MSGQPIQIEVDSELLELLCGRTGESPEELIERLIDEEVRRIQGGADA